VIRNMNENGGAQMVLSLCPLSPESCKKCKGLAVASCAAVNMQQP